MPQQAFPADIPALRAESVFSPCGRLFLEVSAIHFEKEISAMKKKFLALALTAVMALSLAACGGDTGTTEPDPSDEGGDTAGEGQTYTIGIVQQMQHEALDAATQGFQDALTEALGDRVTFD